MTIRRATAADAPLCWQLSQQVPSPPWWSEQDVAEYIVQEPSASWVDDTNGLWVHLDLNLDKQVAKVVWLVPQDLTKFSLLLPLLKAALRDLLVRYPQAATWTVRATFQLRRADGRIILADGGRALCRFWKDNGFPGAFVSRLTQERDQPWEIKWQLASAAA